MSTPGSLIGFPSFGQVYDTEIVHSYQAFEPENPIDIPTSEPASPQVSFTILEQYLPYGRPCPLGFTDGASFADKYITHIPIVVYNPTAGAITCTAKDRTVGTTWGSGSSVSIAAGKYAVFYSYGLTTRNLDDTQDTKLYASAAGLQLISAYMIIYPNKLYIAPEPGINFKLTLGSTIALPLTSVSSGLVYSLRLAGIYNNLGYEITGSIQLNAYTGNPNSGSSIALKTAWDNGLASPRYLCSPYPMAIRYTKVD